MRIYRAMIFVLIMSALAPADCQPGKDFRTQKDDGIEVADLSISGATTIDTTELAEIANDMIGSCFDNEDWRFMDRLYSLFHRIGYISVDIENLRVIPINRTIAPMPVRAEGQIVEGQRCPLYSDKKASFEFLLDHRSNSLEADPQCVMQALASLRKDRLYTKALVQLLDFERNDKNDDRLRGLGSRYPATDALDFPGAVPYLVGAIKESESELVRTNAAATIQLIYTSCVQAAATMLNHEAEKPGTTAEQKDRLQTAAQYVRDLYGGPGPCRSAHGQPTTEEQMQSDILRQAAHDSSRSYSVTR